MTWASKIVQFRSFWIFPILAIVALAWAHRVESADTADLLWLVPAGLLAWSLIEYGLHRFVFHVEIRSATVRHLINSSHLEHHEDPRDVGRLLVKTGYGMFVSALLFGIAFFLTRNWFYSAGLMTGIWTGFLYYEYVHYRVHLTIGHSRMMAYQRRAHFHHHFQNPDVCFGVTSPLWDYVFRTTRRRAQPQFTRSAQ